MTTPEWYEVVDTTNLAQGDVLQSCPVYRVLSVADAGAEDVGVTVEIQDVVVLTQTCDLENAKVEEILVASVLSYRALVERDGERNPRIKSRDFRKKAVDGNLPPYFLLPERLAAPTVDWSLVDFHSLFSMPKSVAEKFAAGGGESDSASCPHTGSTSRRRSRGTS